MAMIKCADCGGIVSTNAKSCPHCGSTKYNKSESLFKLIFYPVVFLIIAAIFAMSENDVATNNPDNTLPKQKTAYELRKEKIESQFSVWNGSHINLTKLIKNSMNDPKSYEHDKTRYAVNGDHLFVNKSFRGIITFGGIEKNTVSAKVDLDGNILEILSEE